MKNILFLYGRNTNEVFNRQSALGSTIHCLANLLKKEGNEVFINDKKLSASSVSAYETTIPARSKSILVSKKFIPGTFKRFFRDRRQLQNIKSLYNQLKIKALKYDIILEFYTLGSDIGLRLSQLRNIPLYVIYEGPIIEEYMIFNGVRPFFEKEILTRQKMTLAHCYGVVVYSNPMKKYVCSLGVKYQNVFINQIYDFSRFNISNSEKSYNNIINVCFIGSFLKWHQVELLIDSFNKLKKKGISVALYLVGDGMDLEKVKKIAHQSPYREEIHFTGFLDHKELRDLKSKMAIGVMPGSNWYGSPNKIFEYGAMKLAVVAPDTPTIKDLFYDDEICFFEWKNGDDLTDKIESLCIDKTNLHQYSNKLHKKIMTDYSPKGTAQFFNYLLNLK
jgi:glycosyltransferase involved in cell wall biosynthesis